VPHAAAAAYISAGTAAQLIGRSPVPNVVYVYVRTYDRRVGVYAYVRRMGAPSGEEFFTGNATGSLAVSSVQVTRLPARTLFPFAVNGDEVVAVSGGRVFPPLGKDRRTFTSLTKSD
jgi:hypothetical protein